MKKTPPIMSFRNPIITQSLVNSVIEQSSSRMYGIHGLTHWMRVERNGHYLAEHNAADRDVISLFALFHDARRVNDNCDPGHGKRGAELAKKLYKDGFLPISAEQLSTLVTACNYHTEQPFTEDPTIACCWDADRLDLPRVGIRTNPNRLNTEAAKQIAASGDYTCLKNTAQGRRKYLDCQKVKHGSRPSGLFAYG
jgi:uncharacterized protein